MSFLDDIQKASGVLTDVKGVVDQGLGIFTDVKDTVFPAKSTSEGVSDDGVYQPTSPTTTGPLPKVTTQPSPSTSGGFLSGIDGKQMIVIGALVIGFLFLRK